MSASRHVGWPERLRFTVTAVLLVGVNAWAHQVADGMAQTHMSDHVSWGLYVANFTFMVGVAAGGVMMVIPAYLYHDEDMHHVVIIGEAVAIDVTGVHEREPGAATGGGESALARSRGNRRKSEGGGQYQSACMRRHEVLSGLLCS